MTRTQNELNTTSPLISREAFQVLRDGVLGTRTMTRANSQSWSEIYPGMMPVEIDSWRLTLFNDYNTHDYSEDCRASDGRFGTVENW